MLYKNVLLFFILAVVDSSSPKSLFTSVKYKDQQKREKLYGEVRKYRTDIQHLLTITQMYATQVSQDGHKVLTPGMMASAGMTTPSKKTLHQMKKELPLSQPKNILSHHPHKNNSLSMSATALPFTDSKREVSQYKTSLTVAHKAKAELENGPLQSHSLTYLGESSPRKSFQDAYHKTFDGDLLEKHSLRFTEMKQSFTPRLLKKKNKSFLSTYRYYSPKKKNSAKTSGENGNKNTGMPMYNSQSHSEEYQDLETKPDMEDVKLDLNITSPPVSKPLEPDTVSREEDEFEYLQFLREVTDEILLKGNCNSNTLESVFQRHMEMKKHDLENVKMRKLLQNLENELNSKNNQLDFSISYTGKQHMSTAPSSSQTTGDQQCSKSHTTNASEKQNAGN
ncbi:spermatogenesis-associated protein 7-like [Protopterus annectens]|uniref:spermatogenesis-associated protein 7-like n=1 Tax=Protopterus annectens TaxID=7888 RepID=UPI001CFA38AA|nr:spermatogenesis-associated protein 7-like [Protopterus annectens]